MNGNQIEFIGLTGTGNPYKGSQTHIHNAEGLIGVLLVQKMRK